MESQELLIFNNKMKRIYHDLYDVQLLGSGSSGNSVIIRPIQLMIDLGLPYAKYPERIFDDISYIALTHEHGDHMNVATVRRVLERHPHITFIMPVRLLEILDVKLKDKYDVAIPARNTHRMPLGDIVLFELPNSDAMFTLTATPIPHGDIMNVAYTVQTLEQLHGFDHPTLLYASDLSTTEPAEVDGIVYSGLPRNTTYDIMLLEANYDEETLNEVLKDDPYNFRANANKRHLSEQKAFNYVYNQLKDDGLFIPLHASTSFGAFIHRL